MRADAPAAAPAAGAPAPVAKPVVVPVAPPRAARHREERKPSERRCASAWPKRTVESQNTAILTTFNEVDMST
ncbi:MAG: hypothetical protein U0168_22435 [Nannocystaceae bacterium]